MLLEAGEYRVGGDLRLGASGVVLRGAGGGADGTVLLATGTSRRSLITMSGRGERREIAGTRTPIAERYVPAGARTFAVEDAAWLSPGARIVVHRPSTSEWIQLLGMNTFPGWRPETRLHWQRRARATSTGTA